MRVAALGACGEHQRSAVLPQPHNQALSRPARFNPPTKRVRCQSKRSRVQEGSLDTATGSQPLQEPVQVFTHITALCILCSQLIAVPAIHTL